MFWNRVAWIYDFVENLYNGKVYRGTGKAVAKEIAKADAVLECACGTGAISVYIAPKCKSLVATDMAKEMLRRTAKKTKRFGNVEVKGADIMSLGFSDNSFDKVVAGNVIHLLDEPQGAIRELMRVCKTRGKVIIPTYVNIYNGEQRKSIKVFEKAGANFKQQFDFEAYKAFFKNAGYENVAYSLVKGRIPCAIAVITKI